MAEGLRIDGLTVGDPSSPIVAGLDLELAPGSTVGLIGPSGSGKTTLLDVLAGGAAASAGSVTLDGVPVERAAVGMVTQEHELMGGLTPVENVAARLLARRALQPDDWREITALLGRLGLPESSWHNLVEQLSGGQQQRVAVAQGLVDRPLLICLDDPTSELDAASAELVWAEGAAATAAGSIALVCLPDAEGGPTFDTVVSITQRRAAP